MKVAVVVVEFKLAMLHQVAITLRIGAQMTAAPMSIGGVDSRDSTVHGFAAELYFIVYAQLLTSLLGNRPLH